MVTVSGISKQVWIKFRLIWARLSWIDKIIITNMVTLTTEFSPPHSCLPLGKGTWGPSPKPLSSLTGTLPSTMRLPRPQNTSGGSGLLKDEHLETTGCMLIFWVMYAGGKDDRYFCYVIASTWRFKFGELVCKNKQVITGLREQSLKHNSMQKYKSYLLT